MHKEFFINCNTLLHVSTLLGHLQGELSVVVTLRLHFTVERECAVDCVLEV
jgi:exonuclease I